MEKKDGLKFSYALSLTTQLGFIAVSSIGLFLVAGIWFDEKFQTEPFGTIIGVLLGIFIAGYESYRMIKPLILNNKEDKDSHD
jgi:F0F1-type ATP synthase assembly protein I